MRPRVWGFPLSSAHSLSVRFFSSFSANKKKKRTLIFFFHAAQHADKIQPKFQALTLQE
jgi:hypothetical protein